VFERIPRKEEKEKVVEVTLHLVDGSRIVGRPAFAAIVIHTSYGKLNVPLRHIEPITFHADKETVSVKVRSGDNVTGVLITKDFRLTTQFGEVTAGGPDIEKIDVRLVLTLPSLLKSALVLYYSFDERGDAATDESGKGNHGKVLGATWPAEGKVGGALLFNGDKSRLSLGVKNYNRSSGTVAMWVKTTSDKGGTVFAQYPSDFDRFRIYAGDTVGALGGHESTEVFYIEEKLSSLRVDKRQWHHVVMSYDFNKCIFSLFVNGIEVDKATLKKIKTPASVGELVLGCNKDFDYTGHYGDYFQGLLDEVMIFNRVLSPSEVKVIYRSQK